MSSYNSKSSSTSDSWKELEFLSIFYLYRAAVILFFLLYRLFFLLIGLPSGPVARFLRGLLLRLRFFIYLLTPCISFVQISQNQSYLGTFFKPRQERWTVLYSHLSQTSISWSSPSLKHLKHTSAKCVYSILSTTTFCSWWFNSILEIILELESSLRRFLACFLHSGHYLYTLVH